jgi:CDP-6-deoxy-D-xylo-4-hexulose-3-dehydrase
MARDSLKKLRQQAIRAAVRCYKSEHQRTVFTPGDRIPYAGRVFDEKEITALIDASLDFWLTAGRYAEKFERAFAQFVGTKYCSLTNSGSSANLLAFMALTSPTLGERRIRRGDEVIAVAAGFPTTVAPIIQYGAVPVFVDISLPTYNMDCSQLEKALSKKTKAIMIAHTPWGRDTYMEAGGNIPELSDIWGHRVFIHLIILRWARVGRFIPMTRN